MHSTMDRTAAYMAGSPQGVDVMSPTQRPQGQRLTGADTPEFTALWRETSRKVVLFLRRLGASAELADDLVQEVAVRLLRSEVELAAEAELCRWSYVVARHLYIDHCRRPDAALCALADLPNTASNIDVAGTVEARLALAHVARLLTQLTESDRISLLQLVQDEQEAPPQSRREGTRLAVQRHRARQRLKNLIAATAALLGIMTGLRRKGGAAMVAAAAVGSMLILVTLPQHDGVAQEPTVPPQPQSANRTAQVIAQASDEPTQGKQSQQLAPGLQPTSAAGKSRDDLRVGTPVSGLGVRTGTAPNAERHLVCAGIGWALEDICLDAPRPLEVPPTGARADGTAQATAPRL